MQGIPHTSKSTEQLVQEGLADAISYGTYRNLMADLVAGGKSTSPLQAEDLADYTLLNDRRMARLDKTLKIGEGLHGKIVQYNRKVTWLVLTESWCGDAAQSMPVMNKIAELNPNIGLRVIFRDGHMELMNRFLYKETLSIPRLLVIDDETGTVIGDWGPRPAEATKMVEEFKTVHGKLTPEFAQDLQVWYNKDKGQEIAKELTDLLLK